MMALTRRAGRTGQRSALRLFPEIWYRLRETLGLSDRELQIVQEIIEDQKQESIGFTLGISSHRVNTYMQRIYAKLRIVKAEAQAGCRWRWVPRPQTEVRASRFGFNNTTGSATYKKLLSLSGSVC
jgi:DNA-binding CsgD family transcriptional regulator